MVGTIIVHGSGGNVLAPVCGGKFIEGRREDVLVTAVSDDEDLPLHIRQAFVGLTISTIFSSEQLNGVVPTGSRVAYASEVAEALTAAKKVDIAKQLLAAVNEHDPKSEHHFLVFKVGEYRSLQ